MTRMRWFALLLGWLIVAVVAMLLLGGHSILVQPLLTSPYVPAGSLMTAIGFTASAWAASISIPASRKGPSSAEALVARLQTIGIGLSLLWFPLGVGLSGNASMTFQPGDGSQAGPSPSQLFWAMSAALALLPLLLLGARLIIRHWSARRFDPLDGKS